MINSLLRSGNLQSRAEGFAKDVRSLIRRIPKTIASLGDCRRLIRCSGAIGEAFINADQARNRQDFVQYISDCCREARQAQHWLRLLDVNLDETTQEQQQRLLQEGGELEVIFAEILEKTSTT